MARKKRQRISYVLPLANSAGGHRLGINGLALDQDRSILYSGARDGAICAWDLNVDLKKTALDDLYDSPSDRASEIRSKSSASTFRNQVQAHTHWVNDIILTQGNSALVSASSDVTVKVWRPHSTETPTAQTIGKHSDYVKCLASPESNADWVASGGLDHKIKLWDLSGAGERLEIDVGSQENVAKGSVYALDAKGSILASGGPESVLRVWDSRIGKSVTKLVGHTDNIRDIIISDDGETVMTASSDQTVKLWSLVAGRCTHTLTMHNDSVWSLYSDHPRLSLFYSSDRSGLVAKTDTRNTADIDEGVSIAAIQESDGVNKIVAGGSYIWTATSSSSINRWIDVDTRAEIEEPPQQSEEDKTPELSSESENKSPTNPAKMVNGNAKTPTIPYNSVLKLSITSPLPAPRSREADSPSQAAAGNLRKTSEAVLETELDIITPVRDVAEACIEGQNGLSKHIMLNDRKRVLTLDTTGEVVLWDLLRCVPLKSFGKRHLDDIAQDINTVESVANWCTVDTRTGKLSVILEENYCFDAEVYADEIELEESIDFREDQRINLGKWVLRNLFAHLIDEEIKRDEDYRKNLTASLTRSSSLQRSNAPNSIALPALNVEPQDNGIDGTAVATPKAQNGHHPKTPGLLIAVATPGALQSSLNANLPRAAEEGSHAQKGKIQGSQTPLAEHNKSQDYFSSNPDSSETSSEGVRAPSTPSEAPLVGATPTSPTAADGEKTTEEKKKHSGLFGKKFQMSFPKKLGRASLDTKPQAAAEADKSEESDDNKSSDKNGESNAEAAVKTFSDNFLGVVQKIRSEYDDQLHTYPDQPLNQGVTPSLPIETPVLKPPEHTQILIQEDNPESGGVQDLYGGTVATLGRDADAIEELAPMWLGELLLRNQLPLKDTVKVSFVLQPHETSNLPNIASAEGNSRLNANRMLRTKKILAYVAERIEPAPENSEERTLRPEEYLELWCQGHLVSPNITLATLRVHIWRTGGDVMLYYRANGKKPIKGIKETAKTGPAPTAVPEKADGEFGDDEAQPQALGGAGS